MMLRDDTPPAPIGPVEDDQLRLIFTCCHPALGMPVRVALTLRLLGGLAVPEIAHAFLVPVSTMARRITRAKAKIAAAHIPYRVPSVADVRERLAGVLAVVWLVFNEGYLASAGDDPLRVDLSDEAIRLACLLRAFHATRADLLRRLGRSGQSRMAYDRAIELVGNPAERAYLARRRDQLGP